MEKIKVKNDGAIHWFVNENNEGIDNKIIKKWMRTVCIQNNNIFVPSIINGNITTVFLCASHDGAIAVLNEDKNYFVEIEWMIKYAKERKDNNALHVLNSISTDIRNAIEVLS